MNEQRPHSFSEDIQPSIDSTDWSETSYFGSADEMTIGNAAEVISEVPVNLRAGIGESALSGMEVNPLNRRQQESPRERRNKKLFAPLVDKSTKAEEEVPNYDFLFADEIPVPRASEYDKSINEKHEWAVTDKTREDAKNRLIEAAKRDEGLREIIRTQAGKIDLSDPYAVVDAIRTDRDFRFMIGTHYLDRVNALSRIDGVMPERIVRNTGKRPDKGEYPVQDMTSREYTAMLCLAKLDGTFNYDAISASDQIEHNARGDTVRGQHRMAADIALG